MSFLSNLFGTSTAQSFTLPHDAASYEAQRAALIAKDRSLRLDHQRKFTNAIGGKTDALSKADTIIRRIRKEEAESVWTNVPDGAAQIFPGMEFLTGGYDVPRLDETDGSWH